MLPVYSAGYGLGYWILHKVLDFDLFLAEPQWMHSINVFFENTIGIAKPCLWSFLLGGNILGIVLGVILFPIMKKVFAYYVALEFGTTYENNYSK